jgi:hypothetical protein
MIKKIILLFLILPLLTCGQNKSSKSHQNSKTLACGSCHDCKIPTKEKPCLKACPRESMVTIDQKPHDAPTTITIDRNKGMKGMYEPVVFSHKAHAEMSYMAGGCKMCHHYNPPGNVVGCGECHESNRKRTDISKPDITAADHRQCMQCHRSWSGSTDCIQCHRLKGQAAKDETKVQKPIRIHPELKTPNKLVFNTNSNQGKLVVFYHDQHIDLFGKECADCHTNQTCNKCHAVPGVKKAENLSTAEKHLKCGSCHDTKSSCNTCHANAERPGFNHKSKTGFDISRYHGKLSCSRCHTNKGSFTGLKPECVNCHGPWTQSNFKHKVTGVVLDEIHSGVECSDCHKSKNYSNPSCKDCHDDKTFPANVPGKLIKKG